MSQLLERLQRKLQSTADRVERAETCARIACHFARDGRFEDAQRLIEELRFEFGHGQSGRATVWIMLAEALLHHYQSISPLALDRIKRALLIGRAMRYAVGVANAAVWKAHVEFEHSDFGGMVESLRIAATHLEDSDHDGRTRMAIVLSNAFMLCGDSCSSQHWFLVGRDQAVRNGDQPSIDALLYNKAAFSLAWQRVVSCVREVPAETLRAVRLNIESASNLQVLMGISALAGHVQLLSARISVLEGRYDDAIESLSSVRGMVPFAAHNFNQALISLEIQFCLLMKDAAFLASADEAKIDWNAFAALDPDEQIYASWLLEKISEIDPRFGDTVEHRARLLRIWNSYEDTCKKLEQSLEGFRPNSESERFHEVAGKRN